jgi:hypothetical protein
VAGKEPRVAEQRADGRLSTPGACYPLHRLSYFSEVVPRRAFLRYLYLPLQTSLIWNIAEEDSEIWIRLICLYGGGLLSSFMHQEIESRTFLSFCVAHLDRIHGRI